MKLKKTKSNVVKLLYQLMYDVDKIFTQNNLSYWAIGGTILGAIRHKGIIPWDDDLDIAIDYRDIKNLLRLRPQL